MVIIVVGEVKSAIIIVVVDVSVDHNHRVPGVEEAVGDDGSEGRTADDVVTIDVAAVNTVVEVVGDAVVVNRSDVVRNVHIAVVVVVVRVYIGGVRYSRTVVRAVSFRMSSGMSSGLSGTSGLVAAGIVVAVIAGTGHRLRLSLTLFGVSALCRGA